MQKRRRWPPVQFIEHALVFFYRAKKIHSVFLSFICSFIHSLVMWSRERSVSWLSCGLQQSWIQFPLGTINTSLIRNVHTDSAAHSESISVRTGVLCPGLRRPYSEVCPSPPCSAIYTPSRTDQGQLCCLRCLGIYLTAVSIPQIKWSEIKQCLAENKQVSPCK